MGAMIDIRRTIEADRAWVCLLLIQHWGSREIVSRGRVHDAGEKAGFIAEQDGDRIGLATYLIERSQCELVTLNGLTEGIGVGTALVEAVADAARSAGCERLWLITTNDNIAALRFYQKRGFLLVAVHRNAMDESRRLKPEIPEIGLDGIPLRDEIELELRLC